MTVAARIGLLTTAALAACATGAPRVAQAQEEAPAVRVEDLGADLYMLAGRGGNIGVSVGEDGVFMIDDQFAPMTPAIADAVAGFAGGSSDVRFIVTTHYHGDHTGGNEAWSARDAAIVAHDNVLVRQMDPPPSTHDGAEQEPHPPAAWPIMTFSDDVTLHMNGETARVIHVEHAHTDGDAIVWFEEANVLHMGDAFFNGLFPYIDTNSGGSVDGYVAAQDYALGLVDDDTKIIPGHGPLASKADLQTMRDVLVDVRDRIAEQLDAGLTLEEAIAADPLKDYDEPYGRVFIDTDTMVRIVYDDLAAKRAPSD